MFQYFHLLFIETIQIKPGTHSGDTSILRGKGISDTRRYGTGNQILKWKVVIPKQESLTPTQLEQLQAFAKEEKLPDPFQLN